MCSHIYGSQIDKLKLFVFTGSCQATTEDPSHRWARPRRGQGGGQVLTNIRCALAQIMTTLYTLTLDGCVVSEWGVVCGDGWGLLEAGIICKQLGLGFANAAIQTDFFGGRYSKVCYKDHVFIGVYKMVCAADQQDDPNGAEWRRVQRKRGDTGQLSAPPVERSRLSRTV